jgi:curved DNA-binding protein CbpA
VACPQPLGVSSCLILRAPGIDVLALSKVRNCTWRRTQYHLGIEFMEKASIQPRNPALEPDHHELLRAGMAGDTERMDRVYRTLAFRYHPDNGDSGDAEIFLRISETYRILSSSKPRPEREIAKQDGTDWQAALSGLKGKRAAVLGLLCQRRIADYRNAFVSPSELETVTGIPPDELGFVLWYLREKGAVTGSDSSPDYSISARGVDILESALRGDARADGVADDPLSDLNR